MMDYMFTGAISFNQNLCDWYTMIFPITSVMDMFVNSACTSYDDPIVVDGIGNTTINNETTMTTTIYATQYYFCNYCY
jgi:hypothetical protein